MYALFIWRELSFKKNCATYITSAPNLRSHFLILLHFILPFFILLFSSSFFSFLSFVWGGGGSYAAAYLATLPTIVHHHVPNIFVHTWLNSNHHEINYVQLKTRGKQKQTLLFGMKICTAILPRTLFVLKWKRVSERKAWAKLLALRNW